MALSKNMFVSYSHIRGWVSDIQGY